MSVEIIVFPRSSPAFRAVLSEAEQPDDGRDSGDAHYAPTLGMFAAGLLSASVWFTILSTLINILADL